MSGLLGPDAGLWPTGQDRPMLIQPGRQIDNPYDVEEESILDQPVLSTLLGARSYELPLEAKRDFGILPEDQKPPTKVAAGPSQAALTSQESARVIPHLVNLQTRARPSGGAYSIQPIEQAARNLQMLPARYNKAMQNMQGKLTEASNKYREAVQGVADVQAEAAGAQAEILRGGMEAWEHLKAENKKRIETARQNVQATMKNYQDQMDKLASMQVDPRRRFSAPQQKIGAVIAVALGAVGKALAGGTNQALQLIQKEIDRDIQLQFAEIDKQRGLVTMAQQKVGMARQLFADEQSQTLAAENAHWQDIKMRMWQMTAESRNPEILANRDKMLAEIETKEAENWLKIAERQYGMQLQAGTAQLGAAQAVVGARGKLAAASVQAQSPPGLVSIGQPTDDDAKKAKAFTANYNRAHDAINELVKWREEYGLEALDRAAIQKGKALTARAIIAMKRADDMGANFTEMEKELLGLADDPGEIGFYLDRLMTIRDSMEREANGFLKPYGYMLLSTGYKERSRKIGQ